MTTGEANNVGGQSTCRGGAEPRSLRPSGHGHHPGSDGRCRSGRGIRRPDGARTGAHVTLGRVPLSRIAWLTTVAISVVVGVVLLADGYTGYGILGFLVGASAAINLR